MLLLPKHKRGSLSAHSSEAKSERSLKGGFHESSAQENRRHSNCNILCFCHHDCSDDAALWTSLDHRKHKCNRYNMCGNHDRICHMALHLGTKSQIKPVILVNPPSDPVGFSFISLLFFETFFIKILSRLSMIVIYYQISSRLIII